jgi:hypothetical protein
MGDVWPAIVTDDARQKEENIMSEPPKLHTLPEVAAAWGLSPHTIRAMVRAKQLAPTRICRRLLFDPEELKRFLRDRQAPKK